MVDRVTFTTPEAGPTPPEKPAEQRPDWQPEGFTGDQAALAKSWADQRAEITRLQQQAAKQQGTPPAPDGSAGTDQAATTPDAAGTETPPSTDLSIKSDDKPAEAPDDAAKKVVDAAGFDVTAFQSEYDTSGDVSEESRDKIAKGLEKILGKDARSVVDQFVEGQKAVHQNDHKMFVEAAGGEEQLTAMLTWAKTGLSKEHAEAYNRQIGSRDRPSIEIAITGLRAKYEAANGKTPNLIKAGGGPVSGSVSPFASSAEMVTAMRDPRYAKDPAYRDQIKARLAISKL